MNKYTIAWIDSTMSRQPSKVFKHWRTTQDNGEWKEVEAWDFIEAVNDKQAIKKARKYVENSFRIIEVFCLFKGKEAIATEEDIWDN